MNILDLGANLQAATDMARFHHGQVTNTLRLEGALHGLVGAQLTAMGHKVERATGDPVGGYQAIMVMPDASVVHADGTAASPGTFRGGSDHRKDGQVVGY